MVGIGKRAGAENARKSKKTVSQSRKDPDVAIRTWNIREICLDSSRKQNNALDRNGRD